MKFTSVTLLLVLCSCAPNPGPVKRKMIGLTEKFDRWDFNGDGQLSASELSEAERLSGFTSTEIIRFYDTSGNGKVSLRETQDGISRLEEARNISEQKDAKR